MPRLLLLRHAKSDWSTPGLSDHDRPLNARGEDAARRMARWIEKEGLRPDLILCSTALRTRMTLAALLPVLGHESEIRLSRRIYDDSDLDYISFLREEGGDAKTLMLIAHNPATHDTACELAIPGSGIGWAALETKFPTGALAVLDSPAAAWPGLLPLSCTLQNFIQPRLLPE
ncbi:SixA phosphatase family protein [Pannonibacter phragmitetus]|uniref:SixA phosphatase family protein n=1 Tax=Pannonibacter phragmitetus TaxID=121719 RepID=UPI003D2F000F